MTKPEKNFDTGLRILEVLKILLNKDVSKNEMIETFKNNENFENVYTQEAFIKYFNTFEIIGLKIEKEKNTYKLKNALNKAVLTKQEVEALVDLIAYIKKLHNKNLEKELHNLIYKTLKYLDDYSQTKILNALNIATENINGGNNLVKYLESLLYDKQLITVTYYKNKMVQETITVELKEIIEKDDDIILVCYDQSKSRNKKIHMSCVVSVKQSPKKVQNAQYLNSVVFRLYGRLSALYKLKQSEKVLDFAAGYITVSNSEEDKDTLIRRLLKYGENCKIIKPKNIQEDFLILTDEILKNLKEEVV